MASAPLDYTMTEPGIAVFAYNRPNHLQRVLENLQLNDVSHIYVFVDGPEGEDDKEEVDKVRNIVSNVNWCDKSIHFRENNIGLQKSIVSGVDRVFEDHDRIIVLEDDCVPSSDFVPFMNKCLEKYSSDKHVMNVTGYSPPIEMPEEYSYDVYFTYRSSSWGWGTWESAWKHFEQDPLSLSELKSREKEIKEITDKAGTDLYPMMRDQLKGNIDSWAIWWVYAIASENGICVNPIDSKIKNIGHDGSGTHSGESTKYHVELSNTDSNAIRFPNKKSVDTAINKRYNEYFSQSGYSQIARQYGRRLLEAKIPWGFLK